MSRGDIARLTQTVDAEPVTTFEFMPRPDGWLVTLIESEPYGSTKVITKRHRFYRSAFDAAGWVQATLIGASVEGGR